jgi:hypothetical protein
LREAEQRAATAARLRPIYQKIMQATATLEGIIDERTHVPGTRVPTGESSEERDLRHDERVNASLWWIRDVGGAALTEPDAQPCRVAVEKLMKTFDGYISLLRAGADPHALATEGQRFKLLRQLLEGSILGHLRDLDRAARIGKGESPSTGSLAGLEAIGVRKTQEETLRDLLDLDQDVGSPQSGGRSAAKS